MRARFLRIAVPVAAILAVAVVLRLRTVRPTGSQEPPARDQPAAPKTSFRIATYNINFANRDLSLVVDAILESDADIVAVQETTPESESYLRAQLESTYAHAAFHGFTGEYYAERFGFLSKHPIVSAEYIEPEHGVFGVQIGVFEIDGHQVQVANLHLQPLALSPRTGPVAFLKAIGKAEKVHGVEIEAIHGSLAQDVPTVVLGDFNSLALFKAPLFLQRNGFADSFASANDDANNHATWEWQTRYGKISGRLDYIFHDASFRTRTSRIIRNNSSDHFLLVSELQFANLSDQRALDP